MAQTSDTAGGMTQHIIKRYGGSRYYDTSTLSYVSVAQIRSLTNTDAHVVVYESETGADITQAVLSRH
jgi:polyhydroxyalkanoate synthesis regulator protein